MRSFIPDWDLNREGCLLHAPLPSHPKLLLAASAEVLGPVCGFVLGLAVKGHEQSTAWRQSRAARRVMRLPGPFSSFTLLQKGMIGNWCSKFSLTTPSLPQVLVHSTGPQARAQSSSGLTWGCHHAQQPPELTLQGLLPAISWEPARVYLIYLYIYVCKYIYICVYVYICV